MCKTGQQDQPGDDDARKIDDEKGRIHDRSLRLKRSKPLFGNGKTATKFRIENSPCRDD